MTHHMFIFLYVTIGLIWFAYAWQYAINPPDGFIGINIFAWPIPLISHIWFLLKNDNQYNIIRDYTITPSQPTKPYWIRTKI